VKVSRVHLALGVLCVLFIAWTITSGIRPGAYTDYLAEWREVLAGHDPWQPSGATPLNAYGPLFNALALLARLDPIAPKLLFAAGYVAFVAWLVMRKAPDRSPRRTHAIIALCLLNPFPWVEIAHFGFFDVLVGIACVGAVHAARRGGNQLAGVLVGMGILVKFLPVVVLPVLASAGRRLRPNLVGPAVLVASAGMAASFALWGPSTFDPLRFAAGRSPVLSIYDVLGSVDSPLRLGLKFELASLEKPLILAAEAALLAWCWWRKAGPAVSALLAVLAVLLFYRSGYNNYQMMAFYLLAYLFAAAQDEFRMTRGLLLALCAYLGALAAIDAGYPVVRRIASVDGALLYLNGSYLLRWLTGCALVAAIMAAARAWNADTQPSTNRGPASPPAPAASSLL
jgi:hypothetical protein